MNGMQEYKYLRKYTKIVGLIFIGKYMEEFLLNYKWIKENTNNYEYLQKLLQKEEKVTTMTAIKIKVDNLLKIIEMNYEKEALALVTISKYVKKNSPSVIEKAEKTLEKILTGEIQKNK